jgi:tetratricopeptide (TPR) repeat protein
MNNNIITAPSPTKPMSRDLMITLLKAALLVGERKYARRIALSWLAFYPGDLEISLLHAQALLQEANPLSLKQALHILDELCASDAEYVEAHKSLNQARQASGLEVDTDAIGFEVVFGNKSRHLPRGSSNKIPKWAYQIREAREKIIDNKKHDTSVLNETKILIHQALTQSSNNLLVAVTHMEVMREDKSLSELGLTSLAEAYHNRWPRCIQFMLCLADLYMSSGDSDQAVSLLHKAVAADINGQVAIRLWGENHLYRALWPTRIEINDSGINTPQSIPIPASIASVLGWNQLPDATKVHLSGKNTDGDENLKYRRQIELSTNIADSRDKSGLKQTLEIIRVTISLMIIGMISGIWHQN